MCSPARTAYTQERALLVWVLKTVESCDLWIDDRNFCTTSFLFWISQRDAFFLVRQHAQNLHRELLGERVFKGEIETGRYVDFLLMGFLFLECRLLVDMKKAGDPSQRGGEPWVQSRMTDRMRDLEALVHEWNLERTEEALKAEAGRRRLLKELRRSPCRTALAKRLGKACKTALERGLRPKTRNGIASDL